MTKFRISILFSLFLSLEVMSVPEFIQKDGKIIIPECTHEVVRDKIGSVCGTGYLVRLLPDGTRDDSWGEKGRTPYQFEGGVEWPAAEFQSTGKVVVMEDTACHLIPVSSETYEWNCDHGLARYDSNGSLDPSFGIAGRIPIDFLTPAAGLFLQGDKILVWHFTDKNGHTIDLLRFDENGELDRSFGTSGRVHIENNVVVKVLPDLKILLFEGAQSNEGRVSRLLSDGKKDSSFKSVFVPHWLTDTAIQPDGKIVFGIVHDEGNGRLGAVRINANGGFDSSFGDNGVAYLKETSGITWYTTVSVADDKIVLLGTHFAEGDVRSLLLGRLNSNGTPDNSFGPGGLKTLSFGPGGGRQNSNMAGMLGRQTDGKLVVWGASWRNYHTFFTVLRTDSEGQFDDSFGNRGVVFLDEKIPPKSTSLLRYYAPSGGWLGRSEYHRRH